jgi:signal transduction histidine kinase
VNDLVYSVATDVSRKMEEERALRASLQRERETAEIKGRLISMASHEFRTPLATIQMAAEMLERYWTQMDRDAIGQRLRLIASTTGELARIISEVLDFSILEAGTTTETPQRIDIVQASREIAEELFDNRGRTHKLIFHSPRESAEMPLMFRLYKHVLANLLENAIKYSAPGSEVELSLEWDKSGRSVRVEVRDHGLGIPEDVRERIWDPFFRASNIGTIRGTGLGLAIAKQAVVAMGGRIDCKPAEKNTGTTFHFTIPARSRLTKKTTPITQS